MSTMILGKSMDEWKDEYPLFNDLIATKETLWINPLYQDFEHAKKKIPFGDTEVKDAEERLKRFAPYIAKVFPETQPLNGLIESPLKIIANMKNFLESEVHQVLPGNLLLKCDSHLPISGSIKARGGIYEILKHAENLAISKGMLTFQDDYSILDSEKFRRLFSKYSIAVGSTGNLGLSIGIVSAKLGFNVTVHMSADAKKWKKDLLRSKGAVVIEYESDYNQAVEEGRKQSNLDPNSYFVDDESSLTLFMGYAIAAARLKNQLEFMNIAVDDDHPLFVYLPCGVGGSPGGVTFGLKLLFKDNVHCFFAEPTHSPCMLIGMMTGLQDKVSTEDFGIDNITAADGLAVRRASSFVGKTMENLLSGIYTIQDSNLFKLLKHLADSEDIYLEPSALAGMTGMVNIYNLSPGKEYLKAQGLTDKLENSTHIVWATGGSMVPKDEMDIYYCKG